MYSDKYDRLDKLNNLRSSGAINEEEFELEKQKILNH
ncbi:SHOCT domain-containing protein [Elizabethkingia anophelis]|nr:SHOCT domain-containing protein [Elizabethkingia anophelis]